jgi:hypothetical protein
LRRDRTPSLSICLGLLLLTGGHTNAADSPDLSQIERRIAKEPVYKAKQPLYALYVFGPEAKTRVWAILDKSKPDAPNYDTLYFDRNADGDLTAPDERIAGKVNEGPMIFDIGSFTDPLTKQKHTEMSITLYGGSAGVLLHTVLLQMKWCDKERIWGGFEPDDRSNTQFATTPAKAPVLWPAADGPISFQFYQPKPLRVGNAEDVHVILGHQGHGRGTFCAVFYPFLPKEVPVLATLLYADNEGKERRVQSELRERC